MLKLIICLALGFGTIALYAPARHYEFLNYDDDDYVSDNPRVLRGLTRENVVSAFTRFHSSNWHPVTWLSHMLDVELWGKNPGGHHVTNVILHAINAVLLFLVFSSMTGGPSRTGSLWRSAFVAAVFAWHPLHVESVAWIAERKDILCGLFWILTMAAYVGYARRPSGYKYLLVVFLFILGLMSKPMIVTLPLVLLLLDYWPLNRATLTRGNIRKWFDLFLEKTPLLLFVVIVGRIAISTQQRGGSLKSMLDVPWQLRMANISVSYLNYLWEAVCPVKLAVLYPLPSTIPIWQPVIAAFVLLLITIFVLAARKSAPYLTVGWLWFVGTLIPVIGLVQIGSQSMADRYTYLSLVGLTIATAWGGWKLVQKMERGPQIAAAFFVLSCVLMVRATAKQLPYWQNSVTLFQRVLSVTTNNGIAESNLSNALLEQNGMADAAAEHAREAVRLIPAHPGAHLNLGMALLRQRKTSEAIAEFEKAVELQPNLPDGHLDLGSALILTRRTDEAIPHFYETLRLDPDHVPALNALGWIRATHPDANRRNASEAIQLAQRAVRLTRGKDGQSLDVLAAAYAEAGKFDEAIKTADSARTLATGQNKTELAREVAERADLYRLGLPFRTSF